MVMAYFILLILFLICLAVFGFIGAVIATVVGWFILAIAGINMNSTE